MEPEVPLGRVTLEDVRGAVEQLGGDPSRTNAAKVREVLGRGGYTTIQKHLEALRVEQAAPEAEEGPETAPEAPKELVQRIWAAAWAEAARRQGKALTEALQKVFKLEERLGVALDDLEGLAEDLDRLEEERQAMVGERAALTAMVEQLRTLLPPAALG
uniref:DNA-binding protein n=1 Tax=Acidithiobacillus caldus TaxID=33059 RepID=UPI0015CF2A50|nr:DNA-binding protein [Acidithiobacillus caldus]